MIKIGSDIEELERVLRMTEFRSGWMISPCRSRADLSNGRNIIEIGPGIRELEQFKDFE